MRIKKKSKTIEFVCCGSYDNNLISKSIQSATPEEASILFEKEFSVKPTNVHGPFYRKRAAAEVIDNSREIQFSGKRIKGIYREWFIVGSILKVPQNSALLLFDKRVDGKAVAKPQGTIIVKIEEIQARND